ncbi:MAG: YdcF family protein [Deltaproteobacteria bacterium]|nr:YdcF family protein [Deltaproteobacteria bacterium]MBI5810283.1 YdcF family protein [Deltaproteobacteria bacterium]
MKDSLKANMPATLKKKRLFRLFSYGYAFLLTIVAVCSLTIMFTPAVRMLAANLLVDTQLRKADAIVVLAGGAYDNGTLGHSTMIRTLHGVELYKKGFADKIIFSGGNMLGHMLGITISVKMSELATDLGVPREAQMLDTVSLRTYENALETKRIMDENRLKDALLVTSATHMKRAMLTFERIGIKVYPAPDTAFETEVIDPFERFGMFKIVMREYAGMLFYRWKGWI